MNAQFLYSGAGIVLFAIGVWSLLVHEAILRKLIAINIAGGVLLIAMLIGNLARLARDYRQNVPGAKLKARMVGMFVGLAVLPLNLLVFQRLPDRGYILARPVGVVLLAWLSWILTNLTPLHLHGEGDPPIMSPVVAIGHPQGVSFSSFDGRVSRIVRQLSDGAGVVTTRGTVHYVVTEYGAVNLFGKSLQERAMAMVSIAHPDFRIRLVDDQAHRAFGGMAAHEHHRALRSDPTLRDRAGRADRRHPGRGVRHGVVLRDVVRGRRRRTHGGRRQCRCRVQGGAHGFL